MVAGRPVLRPTIPGPARSCPTVFSQPAPRPISPFPTPCRQLVAGLGVGDCPGSSPDRRTAHRAHRRSCRVARVVARSPARRPCHRGFVSAVCRRRRAEDSAAHPIRADRRATRVACRRGCRRTGSSIWGRRWAVDSRWPARRSETSPLAGVTILARRWIVSVRLATGVLLSSAQAQYSSTSPTFSPSFCGDEHQFFVELSLPGLAGLRRFFEKRALEGLSRPGLAHQSHAGEREIGIVGRNLADAGCRLAADRFRLAWEPETGSRARRRASLRSGGESAADSRCRRHW